MEIIKNAMEDNEKLLIELKKQYNKNLKRLADGEEYFKENGYDSNFYKYIEIVNQNNVILRNIQNYTDEEIERGFNILENNS